MRQTWYNATVFIYYRACAANRDVRFAFPVAPSMIEQKRVSRHDKTIRAALLPPLLAMAVLATLLLGLVGYLLNANRWVTHSSEVTNQTNVVMRLFLDMQSSKRGYFLLNNSQFLDPYTQGDQQIDGEFDRLIRLVSDNPTQSKRALRMRSYFNRWRDFSDADIQRFRDSPAAITEIFKAQRGKAEIAGLRADFGALTAEENRLRHKRSVAAETAVRVAIIAGGIATLGLGALLAAATRKHLLDLGAQYEAVLEEEAQVRERLATTLTSIGDGVIVTDAQGKITLINPVTESLTGWTNAEAQNKDHQEVFDIYSEITGEPVRSPIGIVLQTNETVMLANHTVLKRRDGSQIAIEDSASPVCDKNGRVTGVVLVFRDVSERKAQEAELAVALAKNTQIAETLQRSMLITPGADEFPGIRFATVYEPAWDDAQVGGDFFDLFSYWQDCVALVVGDATGKGLDAAATTSEVKYALRAYLHDDPDPGLALTRLNRFLSDARKAASADFVPPSFVSLTLAVLNTRTGELATASAGAEVPLLLKTSGETVEAGDTGTMLGASADSLFYAARFVMERGDTLAMVTDGVTEARRGRRDFFGYGWFHSRRQNRVGYRRNFAGRHCPSGGRGGESLCGRATARRCLPAYHPPRRFYLNQQRKIVPVGLVAGYRLRIRRFNQRWYVCVGGRVVCGHNRLCAAFATERHIGIDS